MKDKTYLVISILALGGGICLILLGRPDTFSIGLVLMGIIGTLSGMFLVMNPDGKKKTQKNGDAKRMKPATPPHVCDHSHCGATIERPKMVDNKVVCRYCKCKFARNLDKCPYCGAPQIS